MGLPAFYQTHHAIQGQLSQETGGYLMTPGCVKIHVSSCNKHTRELFCDKCHRCALHHLLVQGEHETQCHGPDQPSSPDKPSGILLGDSQVKDFDFCVPFDWAQ